MIAGPCSVESREQVIETARLVRSSGAVILRGGAFKPRTSPYSFQGLGEEGLKYLKEAGEITGMPVTSEVVSPSHVDLMSDYVDMYQIGARNMQNFELLKAVGAKGMPVLLKRGIAATIEEWLMAAEYLMAHGTDQIVLCERGIRTFEPSTRFTLDVSAIPVVRKLSHLPIIVDPSHAVGIRDKVAPVALGSIAAGADGLIVEVHPRPELALSDGPQALYPEMFEKLMRDIEALAPVVERELTRLPELDETRPSLAHVLRDHGEQGTLLVAFQGEHGAYSEVAVKRYFQNDGVQAEPKASFRDVFEAVLDGTVRYGMVPLENSLAGSIHENYDLFLRYPDLRIAGETQLRIMHSLIVVPGAGIEQIRRVFSHPQGLAQCAKFLDSHPDWERVPFYDTAGAVADIAKEKDPALAAIASSAAAREYGMEVLREGIETNPQNYTRFAVLAREDEPAISAPNKASIVFSTPDTPGALYECLRILADRRLNMKKIESRPIHGQPWRYMFYLDVEIPPEDGVFRAAMDELSGKTEDLRVLGTYRV
jgi:3-deoxy-7-phosphoheptulonate synthase